MENELIKEILEKLGIPGVVISIIVLMSRFNPITAISSSSVEMSLSTKEKRFYIKIIRGFFEMSCYVLLLLLITDTFFKDQRLYNPLIAIFFGLLIFAIFIWITVLDFKGKSIVGYLKSDINRWKKISIFLLFINYFFSIFILPSYYVGTQVYSNVYDEDLTTGVPRSMRLS
ncbi:hypothetical protein [Ornithinibacillus halophilus]|uniref:Uncharacterized protein n=1 Tax=Ornithinibacillus halophilus TaxID=930117 RepID=A0A1M5HF55_9BACI|nr:hypothetical protein [Ornithinibacillus halophilus]SHG14570.1 hypothetical protein SAMN05216225_101734 [Ornithinibacillus halophilus]